jgi:hypothetical protein
MKTPLKLIALVLIFNFSSCSEEELIETNIETQSNIAKSTTYVNANVERLHNIMQWTAYLTTQVLLNSNEGRAQFENFYNNGNTESIRLADLVGNSVQNESFKNALEDEFYRYILIPESCPEDPMRTSDRPRPPHPPGHPETLPGFISWTFNTPDYVPGHTIEEIHEERFQHYLELILDDNCLEIYLPNGYNTQVRNIRSSAHPLLDQNFNDEAYKHISECNVNTTNVTSRTLGNIIIVRPKRYTALVNSNCHYSQYDFDFTDFLD